MIFRRQPDTAFSPRPRFALLLFLALAVALHGWRFLLGSSSAIRFHDTFDSEWPRYAAQARAFLDSGPLAWLPQIAGGMPADAHHFTSLHPLVLANIWLEPWTVFNGLLFVNFLAAAYGAYRLLAVNFSVRHQLALFVALAYAAFAQGVLPISGFEAAIPLIVSLLHDPSPRLPARLGAALAGTALTALAYPILHGPALAMVQITCLLVFWIRGGDFRREIVVAAAYWAAVVLMFVPNLTALLEFLPYSHRLPRPPVPFGDAMSQVAWRILKHPAEIGLLGALAGSLAAAKWDKSLFAAAASLAAGIVAVALVTEPVNVVRGTFLAKMDLYQAFRGLPALYMLVIGLALDRAALVGRKLWRYLAGAGAAVAAMFLAPSLFSPTPLSVLAVVAIAWLLGLEGRRWVSSPARAVALWDSVPLALVLAVGTLALSQTLSHRYADIYGKYAPPAELAAEGKKDPFRVLAFHIPHAPVQFAGVETVEGRGPLFFRNFRWLVSELPARGPSDERRALFWKYNYEPRLDVLTGKIASSGELRLGMLAAMNVRYILSGIPIAGLEPVEFASQRGQTSYRPILAYRVPDAKPRGYFADKALVVDTETAALEELKRLSDPDWLRTAVFARDRGAPELIPAGEGECGSAQTTFYSSDAVTFAVEAKRDCAFVVAGNYHHRWQATIDEKATPVYPANAAFMAIVVPRGTHEIRFAFRPPGHPVLLGLVPLGWIVLFGAFATRPVRTGSGSPGA